MISLQRSMHSSQMYTPGPAISFFTCRCDLPQKEQRSCSFESVGRATLDLPPHRAGHSRTVAAGRPVGHPYDVERRAGGGESHALALFRLHARIPSGELRARIGRVYQWGFARLLLRRVLDTAQEKHRSRAVVAHQEEERAVDREALR